MARSIDMATEYYIKRLLIKYDIQCILHNCARYFVCNFYRELYFCASARKHITADQIIWHSEIKKLMFHKCVPTYRLQISFTCEIAQSRL